MEINHQNQEFITLKQRAASSDSEVKVWAHDFSLKDLNERGFAILCDRGIKFFVIVLFSFICMVPLLYSVLLSFYSLAVDPFEPFMHMFDMFLNFVRVFAFKALYGFVRDAFRTVSYNEADRVFRVETRIGAANLVKPVDFSLSAAQGIEITLLGDVDLAPSAVFFHSEKSYEIALKLESGDTITLFPRVSSAQRARKIAAQIYAKTGLQLVSNACILVD